MDYKTYALMGILLASVALIGGSEAYAQNALTVETDSDSYTSADTIIISGDVGTFREGQPVLIKVTNPNGAIYRFDQVDPAADGSYTYELKVGGNLGVSGEYSVEASYGTTDATTTFDFESTGSQWRTIRAMIGGEEHNIQYMITGSGNSLESITGNVDEASLTAMLETASDGTLSLRFAKTVFDADDEGFFAFIDETDAVVEDMTTGTTERTIAIDFEAGSQEVVIVGDHIIPEFGAIAAIVLAVAIVGIIAVTARNNKFSFLPRQ